MSTRLYAGESWLREAYETKSIYDIATECDAAPSTIRKYLKRFNIKTRSVSESMKLKYQDNEYSDKKHEQWDSEEYKSKHKAVAIKNREKKQEISKQLWQDGEYKERQQKALQKAMTTEVHANIGKAVKKKWEDEEYRQKQANLAEQKSEMFTRVVKEMWQNEEYRQKKTAQNISQGNNRRLSTTEFIKRARKIHDDTFEYYNTDYLTYDRDKVSIKCAECDHEFDRLPGNHLKRIGCPLCKTSAGQREIYNFIRLHSQAILNDRSIIHPYELDILIPQHNFAIEFHGLRWHSCDTPESAEEKNYLQHKYLLAESTKLQLLQFFDFQWELKQDIIKSILLNRLGLSQKYDARKLTIQSIDTAQEFFNQTHLKGYHPHTIALGLYDKQELIMAISLTKRKDQHEITRMSAKLGTIVRGGVSKLLKHAHELVKTPIYTYADLMHSNGLGYQNAGMELASITKPGYFYYKGQIRLSRYQCQKHKLHRVLQDFDPSLSEPLNMFNNGFRRVWDAGHLKFTLN